MAHGNLEVLKRTLILLDNPRNDFYLHIDRKTKFDDYQSLEKYLGKSSLKIIDSTDLRWGDFSLVTCEMNLLETALNKKYIYYHLLSGADLPIKSADYILDFFDNNRGKEFVHFDKPKISDKNAERTKYYYFAQKYKKSTGIAKLFYLIDRASVKTQKQLGLDRNKDSIVLQKGANWFSISYDLADYLLSKRQWVESFFRYTAIPDEMFLQTLVINSKFKNSLYRQDFDNSYDSCKRFIDWTRGSPYVWKEGDYQELMDSNFLFARKFDYLVDPMIVDKIYNRLK